MWGNAEYTQGHIWLVQLSPLKVGEDGYELEQKKSRKLQNHQYSIWSNKKLISGFQACWIKIWSLFVLTTLIKEYHGLCKPFLLLFLSKSLSFKDILAINSKYINTLYNFIIILYNIIAIIMLKVVYTVCPLWHRPFSSFRIHSFCM